VVFSPKEITCASHLLGSSTNGLLSLKADYLRITSELFLESISSILDVTLLL
jgi:hypothetical protein